MNSSSQGPVPVSVIVPIKNEAENLPRCLESVRWADEIFVVDSASTDDSPSVAERYGARVVQFNFNGTWPKKKNWALENLPFRNEWVMILDADEVPAVRRTRGNGGGDRARRGRSAVIGSIGAFSFWAGGSGTPIIRIGISVFFVIR